MADACSTCGLRDGEVLRLASGGGGQLRRWKVGSLNKTVAKQQESILRTQLLTGNMVSSAKARAQSVTFQQWAKQYVNRETVKHLRAYSIRKLYVQNLVEFFGDRPLGSITPDDVRVIEHSGFNISGLRVKSVIIA